MCVYGTCASPTQQCCVYARVYKHVDITRLIFKTEKMCGSAKNAIYEHSLVGC